MTFGSAGNTGDGLPPYEFNSVNINGWIRSSTGGSDGNGTDISTLYDDIYVAWGDYAAARIELGNAATYAACTDLAICESLSWADGSLSVKVREGGLILASATWLYVTLPDNITRYSIQVVV